MLKLPFLEHTVVGLEITSELIRWVELDKLGSRITESSKGEILHNNGEVSYKGAVEEMLQQIKADAFVLALSIPDALVDVLIEEVPYSEEEEENERWVAEREKGLFLSYEDPDAVLLQYHLIQVDEESKRCLFQVLDQGICTKYTSVLEELGLFPKYLTAGVVDTGYAQIANAPFLEGMSGVVSRSGDRAFLLSYQHGLVHNVFECSGSSDEDWALVIQEADSYLKTEEASYDLGMDSIPLFIPARNHHLDQWAGLVSRSLEGFVIPKRKEAVSPSYMPIEGVCNKTFYPELDAFNFSLPDQQKEAVLANDKKETLRLSILLFAPLIFFALVTYAYGKVLDYRLVESNQIMGQIGDKIEEVTEKREHLVATRDEFLRARNMLEEKESSAFLFELVSKQIPDQVWLTKLTTQPESTGNLIQLNLMGYARSEQAVSGFLQQLERADEVRRAGLVVSQKEEENRNGNRNSVSGPSTIRFEIQVLVGS
ncbi:MAG: hypothetical protein ED557_11980 [Balneola sp.]|nr:MAG: hypothetical protein ED557_11980 [Balneola sp.]